MIANTGWTWEYIDNNMTLPRLHSMAKYWRKAPPLTEVVAALMKALTKEKEQVESDYRSAADKAEATLEDKEKQFTELMGLLGSTAGMRVRGKHG